jgi:cation diffusion facilitator family transporter
MGDESFFSRHDHPAESRGPEEHGERRAHHTHGVAVADAAMESRLGQRAVVISFLGLMLTAVLQLVGVALSGSAALLADTLHNFADAGSAVPLWVAFSLGKRKPSRRFTYGLGRVEDLAGLFVILLILASAVAAGYEAVQRLLYPRQMTQVVLVAVMGVVGSLGNELVARYRLHVGREIHSAALVADGQHARADGLTSLGVALAALGVWLGFPLADPIVGLLIMLGILRIGWTSAKEVLSRLLDGVDPELMDTIREELEEEAGGAQVAQLQARWVGHRVRVDASLVFEGDLSLESAHLAALHAGHHLEHAVPVIEDVRIVAIPKGHSPLRTDGELIHAHDGLPQHTHAF